MKYKIFTSLILIVILLAAYWALYSLKTNVGKSDGAYQLVAETHYQCAEGKQIKADYYKGMPSSAKPDEMPIPAGQVRLILSDGRNLTLPQTLSGSGIRYANSDETVIFWSKGSNAFITENGSETFSDCAERIWTLGNDSLDNAVISFLLSRQELSWKTAEGSSNFCVFQNLAPEKELFPHYLWVRCGEFKAENGQLKELSGVSAPIKLVYPNELSFFDQKRFSISIPRDGSLYDKDVKTIFPPEVQNRLHFESGPLNEKLHQLATDNLLKN